jgi:hypothetical protein
MKGRVEYESCVPHVMMIVEKDSIVFNKEVEISLLNKTILIKKFIIITYSNSQRIALILNILLK